MQTVSIHCPLPSTLSHLASWSGWRQIGINCPSYIQYMVNAVDIVVSVLIGLIVIAVSFYLFTMYCHPEQRGFGNALFPKILVVASQALAWGQVLLLPLDLSVSLDGNRDSFQLVYSIYYPVVLFFVAFLNPIAMFFYESDEAQSTGKRVLWSILFAFAGTALWSAFIFISYVWVGLYDSPTGQQRLAVTLYIFLVLSLVGWVLLAFNGGIGLIYLPAELIEYFVMRPKQLTSEEANSKKTELQTLSSELIAEGEQLRSKAEEVQKYEGGWLGRKRTEGKFNSLMEKFKKKVNSLEQNYEIFDAELKIRTTHPVVFFLALLGGILGAIVSIFWVVQILGTMLFRNGKPLFLFMDQWLMTLSRGSASFVATVLYGLLVLYLQVCLVKGNTVFGIRIPFLVKLHPLLLNKTYMNSLLFNANLMLLASLSTSLLALWAFPTYLQPTYLSLMQSTAFNYLPLFGSFYGNRIPMFALEAVALLALLVKIGLAIYRSCKSKSK